MREIITSLNWVDVIIGIALLRGAYIGYKAGLLVELVRFFVHFTAFFSAYYLGPAGGEFIQSKTTFISSTFAGGIAGLAIFLLVLLVLKLFTFVLLKLMKEVEGKIFSVLGVGIALGRTLFAISAIMMAIQYIGIGPLYEDMTTGSLIATRVIKVAPMAFEYAGSVLPPLMTIVYEVWP